nr:transposase [Salsipaludibacter albus]
MFTDLDSLISLAFLTRFPTVDKAAWLSVKRFATWLAGRHYSGGTSPETFMDRLDAAPAGHGGAAGDTAGRTTLAYVAAIQAIREQIDVLERDLADQLADHPDAHIFTSLPRVKVVRATKLLAEIGDARGRFPTEASLAALAGACPSTRQSGRRHVVTFRWACDKKLRAAVMDFADGSRHGSPWAAAIYDRHRAMHKSHQHAVRILARAWLRVIWRCWQDHTAYDPTRHGNAKAHLTTAA